MREYSATVAVTDGNIITTRIPRVAWSSTNIPSRQLPSVMTFGVSMLVTTRRPRTSVPSTSPSRMSKARVARQKS
jgi:hypothetical protein